MQVPNFIPTHAVSRFIGTSLTSLLRTLLPGISNALSTD